MKNKLFFAGILIAILTIIFVVTGCDNPSGGTPAVTPAEQLAADLNAIKTGCATVKGTTVKLTGAVSIENHLTVPTGVTLDMAAGGTEWDKGLVLRNGVLTVNGTVNAESMYIRLEDSASTATIRGSGTIYLKGKGTLLEISGNQNRANRILILDGGVTLVGLEDNDKPLVEVRSGGEGRTGTFVMEGGKITGNTHTNNSGLSGGGVKVRAGGTFIMDDGEISGNTAQDGGGGASGGGVAVEDPGTTFTMRGGTISGNTAQDGGGVKVDSNAVFTLIGGRIQGNTNSDGFTKNTGTSAAISVDSGGTAKWGTVDGASYTKGGVAQTNGSNIGNSDDTLIAILPEDW